MTGSDMRYERNSGNGLYDALYNQRRIVAIVIVVGLILTAAIIALTKAQYSATATILMVAEPPESRNSQVPVTATKPLLAGDLPTLVTSETVLARFRQDIDENITFDALRKRIRARVGSESNIMPVQYTGSSPGAAVRGANSLADEVAVFYRELATQRFDSLIADLQRQTSEHARKLARLDGDLQTAAQKYPYIDVSPTVEHSVYQRLIALRSQRDELLSTIGGDKAAAKGARRLISNAQAPAMRDIIENDAAYRSLRDQYLHDSAQLKRLQSRYTGTYPEVQDLQQVVAREQAELAQLLARATAAGPAANLTYAAARDATSKADAQLRSDISRVEILNAQINDLNDQISKGGIAAQVARIRRDRDNEQSAYSTLAARLAATVADRSEAASTGSVTVIDHARFASRAVWTTSTYLATAVAFLTIWAAVSLALLLESKKERSGETEDIIRGIYDAPLLGSV
jgi:uncharacterized protein involved in exopolysaccharide biosynthesis